MGLAILRTPFSSLTVDDFISRGSAGQIFAISDNLVLKCPTRFIDPAPEQSQESEESIEKIEREKSVYRELMRYHHPHVVRAVLCAPEGIFMQRLKCTLRSRLDSHANFPVSLGKQCRWIQQLTSAVEWLERLGYAHGDLRPANILLDAADTIKVGDFDSTVRFGEQLLVTTVPFCKLEGDYEAPVAGAVTEQYAVGSCIYNIRTGFEPYHDIDGPVMVRKLMKNEFPPTSDDYLFGGTILKCWRGRYSSIRQLRQAILTDLRDFEESSKHDGNGSTAVDLSSSTDLSDQALMTELNNRALKLTGTLQQLPLHLFFLPDIVWEKIDLKAEERNEGRIRLRSWQNVTGDSRTCYPYFDLSETYSLSLKNQFETGHNARTRTSQAPLTVECSLPVTTTAASSRYRSVNDTSYQEHKKFLLVDTPGHGKLRHHALDNLIQAQNLKGIIYMVDAADISAGSVSGTENEPLRQAAEYLYDILLLLQKRTMGSKPRAMSLLVAANKLDLFTALPAPLVKTALEAEITNVRESRNKGLLDSGVGMSESDIRDEKEWLGDGEGKFDFSQMVEANVSVTVAGGSVIGADGPDVKQWWDWVGNNL
ncbi:MAG: hypothetical protein Q9163_003656 [Psora crenata]